MTDENEIKFEKVSNSVATWQELWDNVKEKNSKKKVLIPLPTAFTFANKDFTYMSIMRDKENRVFSIFIGFDANDFAFSAVPSQHEELTDEDVDNLTLTVEEVWEMNKEFAGCKALFQLPGPIQVNGKSWNFMTFVYTLNDEGRKCMTPILAKFDTQTNATVYCVTTWLYDRLTTRD